jgi:hypothetical protein
MDFTKINLSGISSIDFPIVGAAPTDPFILKSVDGLGPPEIDVSIAQTLNNGGVYQGSIPQNREIVMTVGLNPDYVSGQTVSNLREMLYSLITPGSDNVVLNVANDLIVVATTTGYVKTMVINPFSKDPEAQITIESPKIFLEASDVIHSIPVNYVNGDGFVQTNITNIGSGPSGFHMEITITTDELSGWDMRPLNFDPSLNLSPYATWTPEIGDILIFDTRPGYRGIWYTRSSSAPISLLYTLATDDGSGTTPSPWLMLKPGLNSFITDLDIDAFIWNDFYYLPQYWGI